MKLSIITINYNDSKNLLKTIESVVDQTWKEFEYIVIDGGSKDRSVDVIMQYKEQITYWISEPDSGIFNAMNKGIRKATGEYLLMLNAGDILYDKNVLTKVFKENKHDEDIIYGDVLRESNGKVFTASLFPERLSFGFLKDGAISHQAAFMRRKLHEIVGLYDEGLKLCSDWSFILLAICKYEATHRHLNYKISICNTDGLTCSPANAFKIRKERAFVLDTFFAFYDSNGSIDKSNYQRKSTTANKFSVPSLTNCRNLVKMILFSQLKPADYLKAFYEYTSFFISCVYASVVNTFKGRGV